MTSFAALTYGVCGCAFGAFGQTPSQYLVLSTWSKGSAPGTRERS